MKYPNGKLSGYSAVKQSTSNRGMSLEKDIAQTNTYYLAIGLANIHKKPTPVQIVKVDYPKRSSAKITEAYFKLPSTTDFNGIYCGKYIDFEAKECNSAHSFPFTSIHKHQVDHLADIVKHGGFAFLLIRFTQFDKTYLIEAHKFIQFYFTTKRKSLPYTWVVEHGHIVPMNYLKPVDYLSVVKVLMEEK